MMSWDKEHANCDTPEPVLQQVIPVAPLIIPLDVNNPTVNTSASKDSDSDTYTPRRVYLINIY